MSTIIISNISPFTYGQMSNQCIAKLVALNTQMVRLYEAIATASNNYPGTPGTEFETSTLGVGSTNLFGVLASETPGEQGLAYQDTMGQLSTVWTAFWTAAEPFISQLDNGTISM
jgi:hypothetical protein